MLLDAVTHAQRAGLIVIADAKRCDISSSADGYARAFLEKGRGLLSWQGYGADAVTLNGFLGRDSLEPFVDRCKALGKGCFVLVKTSNRGSTETQDLSVGAGGEPIFGVYARIVRELGESVRGEAGYSSVGAVVGATFPEQAERLRLQMPHAIVLVPGYGSQGACADDVAKSFNDDGLGAVVNASRSITYKYGSADVSRRRYDESVRENVVRMIDDILPAIRRRVENR